MRRLRADVVRPVHVSVHPRAAARTPKAAPARRGRLDVPTHTTRSRRIRLVDPFDGDALSRGRLTEVPCELPMRPLADPLVRLLAQTDASLDVTHVPHRDLADPLLRAEVHHLARRLVEDFALQSVQ